MRICHIKKYNSKQYNYWDKSCVKIFLDKTAAAIGIAVKRGRLVKTAKGRIDTAATVKQGLRMSA